jgi:hypothetical protein
MIFLSEYIPGGGPASVFTVMQIKSKHPRAPRVLVDRRPPALAAIVSNPNLTTSVEVARETAALLWATRPMVHYFDPYGGFSRIGRVVASHTVTRGKRKGTIVLTIATMPKGQLTLNSNEVEMVQ